MKQINFTERKMIEKMQKQGMRVRVIKNSIDGERMLTYTVGVYNLKIVIWIKKVRLR